MHDNSVLNLFKCLLLLCLMMMMLMVHDDDVAVSLNVCNIYTDGGLTPCQRRRQEYFLHPSAGDFVPHCKADGRYEELQCHGSVRYSACWCSGPNGKEIPGSRTPGPLICPSAGIRNRMHLQ